MTPANLAKKPVAEMEDSTVVGKILEKWGEFRPLPCWHRSGKKGDFQWFFLGAWLAQRSSFLYSRGSASQLRKWRCKCWWRCGWGVAVLLKHGSHGSGDWPTMWVKKNLGIPIPFTAKIAGSRWSSRQNMVSIGDQSPCYMRCYVMLIRIHPIGSIGYVLGVKWLDPPKMGWVSCYTIFDRDRGS